MRGFLFIIVLFSVAACSQKTPARIQDFSQAYYKDSRGDAASTAEAERVRDMRLHKTVAVRRGDDVYAIAERYNTTTREIIEFNHLKPPYNLSEGQQLKISRPQVYVARYGETLQSISRKQGLDISELARINELKAPYAVEAGQQLRLPYRAFSRGGNSSFAELPTSHATQKIEVGSLDAPRKTIGKIESNPLPPARNFEPSVPQRSNFAKNNSEKKEAPKPRVQEESSWNPFSGAGEEKHLPESLDNTATIESDARVLPAPKQNMAKVEAAPKREQVASVSAPAHSFESAPAKPAGAAIGFIWPLKGKVISDFGPQKGGIHNDGINIAAPVGTAVKVAADGEVIYTGTGLKSYGKLVIVKHKNGWVTAYAHNSEILVKSGQRVRRGQTISKVGNSGRVEKPQLHFAIRQGQDAVDPLDYLGS